MQRAFLDLYLNFKSNIRETWCVNLVSTSYSNQNVITGEMSCQCKKRYNVFSIYWSVKPKRV